MKTVNETRERMHLELALAVAEFELNHKVTYCKPQKNKVSRAVRGKEKLVFKSKQPVNRPCVMFDNVPLVV
jgi:hypothetical protein